MASDFDILRRAMTAEDKWGKKAWDSAMVAASRADINRLLRDELIELRQHSSHVGPGQYGPALYKLTQRGRSLVWSHNMEAKMEAVPASTVIEAMSMIIGFEDVKDAIASSIEMLGIKRVHYLLSGPPACAKSLFCESVRQSVPGSYIIFGSRTSSAGLSDILFEHQPRVLIFDELDKARMDTYSVLLGLMETGEILESKVGKTRGVTLETMVIAAANKTDKMPPEVLSRFALHVAFPKYTRDEFVDVVRGFLSRANDCPEEIAELIGQEVFDYDLGDVRKARGVWDVMKEPTAAEVHRVIAFMQKYSPDNVGHKNHLAKQARKIPGF